MSHPFDDVPSISPSADNCFGRDNACAELEESVTQCRSALLFGGRQAGKTTLLLRFARNINTLWQSAQHHPKKRDRLAVYVNLLELPGDAAPADFYRRLITRTIETCRIYIPDFSVDAQSLSPSPDDGSIEMFVARLKHALTAFREHHIRIIFLLDESKRILGSRFPRGFQDNLFALLYGAEFDFGGRIYMVFSGAQEIYRFCIDDTSPIGSRASKHILTNLTTDAVQQLLRVAFPSMTVLRTKRLSRWLLAQTGGHAGITCGLLRYLAGTGVQAKSSRSQRLSSFVEHHSEIFNLWLNSLSKEARCLHDLLGHRKALTLPQIVDCLVSNGFDRFQSDRAREQLQFTGIACRDRGRLVCVNQLYWNYVANFTPRNQVQADRQIKVSNEPADQIPKSEPMALIMKGGGVKGLAYVAAFKVLSNKYQFNWFVGTSAGAITAVLLGAGYTPNELETILRGKDFRDFFDASWRRKWWNLAVFHGFYKAEAFTEWLDRLLADKLKSHKRVKLSDLPYRVTVYASQRNRRALKFDSKDNDADAAYSARCSMSIPFFLCPNWTKDSVRMTAGCRTISPSKNF